MTDGGTELDYRSFGHLLRGLRRNAGLSQEELGQRAGLSPRTIGTMERDTGHRPYRRSVELLADALRLAGLQRAEFVAASRGVATGLAAATRPVPPDPAVPAGPPVPRQLPAPAHPFLGRAAELAALDTLLSGAGSQPGVAVVSAAGGAAGVGKTALAVYWAHRVAGQFPDGQLYVDLQGWGDRQPVQPGDALAGFLRALGAPGENVPPGEDERSAWYRGLLAGRRMLVVLDNAAHAGQVRPLLPGTPGCLAVVTSRGSLASLAALDGALRIDLEALPAASAVALLRELVGERATADPAAATELAAQCAGLPLALRIVAELAVARPAMPLAALAAQLAAQLADQRAELAARRTGQAPAAELAARRTGQGPPAGPSDGDTGDGGRTSLLAVLALSCRQLEPAAARMFRLLGLHPGPDLDEVTLAVLAGSTLAAARRALSLLADAQLAGPSGQGRYSLHDLLRAYARDLAARDDPAANQAALDRLFGYYLDTAGTMLATEPPGDSTHPALNRTAARAWLDAQRANLPAVADYATQHGRPEFAVRLSALLARWFALDAWYFPEAVAVHTHARTAALVLGDRAAEAAALAALGVAELRHGERDAGAVHLREALTLTRAASFPAARAAALAGLASIEFSHGRYGQSQAWFGEALALYRETGDGLGEARVLGHLGAVHLQQGRGGEAGEYLLAALTRSRETGERTTEAQALYHLAVLEAQRGHREHSLQYAQQNLDVSREIGDRGGMATALRHLGVVASHQGRYQEAASCLTQAMDLYREAHDGVGAAATLTALGDVSLSRSHVDQARNHYAAALELATAMADRDLQSAAHHGLAHAWLDSGDPGRARHHWRQALTIATELGLPEAGHLRNCRTGTPTVPAPRPANHP